MYEKSRELAQLSLQQWLSKEVFSLGWFIILGLIIVFYVVWLILLDRKRASKLLLIGSLAAVGCTINYLVLGDTLGLIEYKIRLLPFYSPVFFSSITLSPIIMMLAEQYSSSWPGYMVRCAVGFTVLNIIFYIFTLIGILAFYHWNVFYHFLVLFGISLLVRLVFLWINGTQKRYQAKHGSG